jgi:hypothetical protein
MMESEKEAWVHVGVEGEGRKTEMGVGEGSTVLPSHDGLHRRNIRKWDKGERTERLQGNLLIWWTKNGFRE